MSSLKVYKASAGSGKTFTLAIQYIRLLITSDPTEYLRTLAVTFTNKATTEMKDRILEQLYGIGHSLPRSESYLKALQTDLTAHSIHVSEDDIRKRCRESLHMILHDYSRFRIETIDSFFQAVLRNLARELGLSAKLQIDLNDRQILSQAVDNMVDGIGKTTLSEGQDHRERASVASWIDNYVKEQIENADNWDIRNKIKHLAKLIFTEEYMKRDEAFHGRINDEQLLKEFRKRLYAMRTLTSQQLQEAATAFDVAFRAFPYEVEKAVSRGAWIRTYYNRLMRGEYAEAVMTDKQKESLSDPLLMLKKDDRSNASMLEAVSQLAEAIIDMEKQREEGVCILNTIELSIQHINPLRLLNEVEKEVTDITNDSNRFILAKTPILLYRLIEGCDAPFVFERMGTLFRNVMIDEFQDTSKLQWENFKVLLLESLSSGGSNLLVGDIKQSIYRFRNGDWHILKNIDREMGLEEEDTRTLLTNFRSDVHIIAFNNAFFGIAAQLLDAENEKGIIQDIYSDVAQQWPEGKAAEGHVEMMLKTGKVEEWDSVMLNDLCQKISELHEEGLPYHEMCVLLRSRTHVKELIDHVWETLGVKMVSDEGFKLAGSRTLNMLLAALRVLCYREQDPVSAHYLMQQYLALEQTGAVSVEQYAASTLEEVLPQEFLARREELREYPLHELCEELYRILRMDRIGGEDAYLMTFYDELQNYLRNGTSDIPSFLDFWETDMCMKDIPACQIDGINIVTIHKSKGLQYHTVFMPYCDSKMEDIRYDEMLWCETPEAPFDTLGALPINGAKTKFLNSSYSEDYHKERLQRRIEELNALYVAFTRAEHNLYIWGATSATALNYADLLEEAAQTSLGERLAEQIDTQPTRSGGTKEEPILTWSLGTPVSRYRKAAPTTQRDPQVNRMSPDYVEQPIRFCSFNRQMDFRQSNEAEQFIHQQGEEAALSLLTGEDSAQAPFLPPSPSYIEQGKLLHDVFSHIERASQLDKVLTDYLHRGLLKDRSEMQHLHRILQKALSMPMVKSWFDGTYKIQNECEIVHLDAATGRQVSHRPDRVMLSQDEVIVVDFKFARPKPASYIPQVQGYMNLLIQMHPDKHIKGYLWYVYQNKIEAVGGRGN